MQIQSTQALADTAGIEDLRAEAAALVTWGIVAATLLALAVALVVDAARQPSLMAVLGVLLATIVLGRMEVLGRAIGSLVLALGLAAATLVAVVLFPGHGYEILLAVPILASGTLLGPRSAFAFGGATLLATGALYASTGERLLAPNLLEPTFVLILATTFVSAIGSRPTVRALEWAWHNYDVLLDRTETLRDRQGELGRLTKSLNETVLRLEQSNAELARARRAADEARQLKADFAAMVSHELRTPLNLIIGFGEMLVDPRRGSTGTVPGTLRPGLEAIVRNARHISRLVDDILDLSQIDAHRMALEKRPVLLSQVVDEAIGATAAMYTHLGLSIEADLPDDLPPIHADGDRIRQILINLLNNAARFTERGGVTVRARRDGNDVVIRVADSGSGIAPEDLPHVFEHFRQVGADTRRLGGSGLGLAVCKLFAEMHGGHMWAESQLGVGSRFHLSLPIGQDVVSEPHVRDPSTVDGIVRTIVVVDRQRDTGKLFQRYLDGYRVLWARSAGAASRLAGAQPVHAAVVTNQADLEAWRRAQRQTGGPSLLPTYLCSVASPRGLATELGVADYLLKPIGRDQVVAAVRRHGREASDVLIVEDDPEMIELLRSFVAQATPRAQVRTAADGALGWALARERRPDLLLLDLQTPRMPGQEVIAALKGDPDLRETPVIVITGRASREEAVHAEALTLSRLDGLSVGETMRCLQASLDALLADPATEDGQARSPGRVA